MVTVQETGSNELKLGYECPVLEPIVGLLTAFQIRTRPTRQCLTCEAHNLPTSKRCKVCKRLLLAEWMKTDDGQPIIPGSIIADIDRHWVGIVTAIKTVPPEIEVHIAKEQGSYLELTVIPREQLGAAGGGGRRLRAVAQGDGRCVPFLGRFALCGDCRRPFRARAPNAPPPAPPEKRPATKKLLRDCQEACDEQRKKHAFFRTYKNKKQELLGAIDWAAFITTFEEKAELGLDNRVFLATVKKVLSCMNEIKRLELQIREIKRSLEPEQIWCPYCTWKPQPLELDNVFPTMNDKVEGGGNQSKSVLVKTEEKVGCASFIAQSEKEHKANVDGRGLQQEKAQENSPQSATTPPINTEVKINVKEDCFIDLAAAQNKTKGNQSVPAETVMMFQQKVDHHSIDERNTDDIGAVEEELPHGRNSHEVPVDKPENSGSPQEMTDGIVKAELLPPANTQIERLQNIEPPPQQAIVLGNEKEDMLQLESEEPEHGQEQEPAPLESESGDEVQEQVEEKPPIPVNQLPEGWEAHWDEDQNCYFYYNEATGESTWDPPSLGADQISL